MLNSEISIIRRALSILQQAQNRFEEIQELKKDGITVILDDEKIMEMQDEVDHAIILLNALTDNV